METIEDKTTEQMEDVNLNQEQPEQENQWPTIEELQKEIENMRRQDILNKKNSEKWVQKVLNQLKEKELFEKWVSELTNNPKSLIEIYNENPTVATKIAKVYWFDSVIDYAKDQGLDFQPKQIDIDKIREDERLKIKQEQLQEKIDDFFNSSIQSIDDETQQDTITDQFNKYLEKFKPTSLDDAKDLYDLAYKKVVWIQKDNSVKAVKNMAAATSTKTNTKIETKIDKHLEDAKALTKALWL